MALTIGELQWSSQPLLPEVIDAAWENEVRGVLGVVPRVLRHIAPSEWVRRAFFDLSLVGPVSLREPDAELAGLVTSQENACRYCYGVARARMRMIGFTDELVDRIERSAQLSEADPRDRALVRFCRNLARSKPRPDAEARSALEAAGFTRTQAIELVWVVACVGFCNRVSTLLAVQPELELEASAPKGLWDKFSSWIPGRSPIHRPDPPRYPPPDGTGIFAPLVALLGNTQAAATLHATMKRAFSGGVLPERTMLLLFAVVARTLECAICEERAAARLIECGIGSATFREVLATLGSPALDDVETLLVPWARDTVWMPEQPSRIQETTRPLLAAIGPERLLDAIGTVALANACARIAMLAG